MIIDALGFTLAFLVVAGAAVWSAVYLARREPALRRRAARLEALVWDLWVDADGRRDADAVSASVADMIERSGVVEERIGRERAARWRRRP